MTRDQLIVMLLVVMAIALAAEIAYILARKKRRKREMSLFRKREVEEEPLGDRAHNTVITTESISRSLAGQGVDTAEADGIISEARRHLARKNYAEAIERAEAAKIALLRAKREKEAGPSRRAPEEAESGEPEVPVAVKEERAPDALPTNYMQSKFMIATTKDLLEKRGLTSGEAHDLYREAVRLFDAGDYTKALSCAIRADRLLDSETVMLIGGEKAPTPGSAVEILVCPSCESEITGEDAFCRECGQNLAAAPECPGCGNDVETSDKFCRKCGTRLR